jgi:hypothetical protein
MKLQKSSAFTPASGPEGALPESVWPEGVWPEGVWPEGVWPEGVWPEGVWPEGVWPEGVWKDIVEVIGTSEPSKSRSTAPQKLRAAAEIRFSIFHFPFVIAVERDSDDDN